MQNLNPYPLNITPFIVSVSEYEEEGPYGATQVPGPKCDCYLCTPYSYSPASRHSELRGTTSEGWQVQDTLKLISGALEAMIVLCIKKKHTAHWATVNCLSSLISHALQKRGELLSMKGGQYFVQRSDCMLGALIR